MVQEECLAQKELFYVVEQVGVVRSKGPEQLPAGLKKRNYLHQHHERQSR